MNTIQEARFYRSSRPVREMINITYRDGGSKSGTAESLLPELKEWLETGNKIAPAHPKGFPNHLNRLAYQDHPLCRQPEDETRVWRYMAFDQLISLLINQKLWFSRARTLQNADPFEGTLPHKNSELSSIEFASKMPMWRNLPSEKLDQFVNTHRLYQKSSELHLICCFNTAEYESNAMWQVYGKGINCVAISTTLGNLKRSFGPYVAYDVLIGKIEYIDYKTALLDESNYLAPLLHKTPFYQYENELRCLIMDDGDNYLFDDLEPNPITNSSDKFSPGTYVPVNLNDLIKELVVGPQAEDWFMATVTQVMDKFELNIPVRRSSLQKE